MKPPQRTIARKEQMQKLCQNLDNKYGKLFSKMDKNTTISLDKIKQFQNSFGMQVNTIAETERLSNFRAQKLEEAVQEVQFWNHLKQGIIERQKRGNIQIARVAENTARVHQVATETERTIQNQLNKEREAEAERRGKFKNQTNTLVQADETSFNTASKTIKVSFQKNKQPLQLRFLPQRRKYVAVGQCHPRVAALVGHFNFHKDVQRLQRQVSTLMPIL